MPDTNDLIIIPAKQPIQSTITRAEALQALEALDDAKAETLAVEGKSTAYVKKMVERFHPFWWNNLMADLNSEDKDVRKSAMIEFNKLQCRVLPTEIGQSADSEAITLNIQQFVKPLTDE